jgi:hypothetical protein
MAEEKINLFKPLSKDINPIKGGVLNTNSLSQKTHFPKPLHWGFGFNIGILGRHKH